MCLIGWFVLFEWRKKWELGWFDDLLKIQSRSKINFKIGNWRKLKKLIILHEARFTSMEAEHFLNHLEAYFKPALQIFPFELVTATFDLLNWANEMFLGMFGNTVIDKLSIYLWINSFLGVISQNGDFWKTVMIFRNE